MGIKNKRVLIQAAIHNLPAIWGTLKTVAGVRVVEVHSGYYFSPCLKAEACRIEGHSGWVVDSSDRGVDGGKVLSRREDALLALEDLASRL